MSNQAEISEIMANAKKLIEQKKEQLGIKTVKPQEDKQAALMALKAKIAASVASAEVQNMLEQNKKVDQTQLTIQEQIIQRQLSAQERDMSLNIIIDSEGRTVDKRTGQVVQIQSRTPTIKANLKAQKRDHKTTATDKKGSMDLFASGIASTISMGGAASVFQAGIQSSLSNFSSNQQMLPPSAAPSTSDNASEFFFDSRLKLKPSERNKRKLAFNEKGKYEDIANKLRTKAKLNLLQHEISAISKKTGIASESRLSLIQPKRFTKDTIPSIEWWDYAILNEVNYDCLEKLNENELIEKIKITRLIEHPVQMKAPTQSDKKVAPAVMLTAKERKKIRRQNRAEALKEEQEKIRLGLIAPPEPKVKISNLMRVLGTEAVQDPTKVEEYVRNQMAKRQKMHEEHNLSRKLTDAERAAKKKKKIMENTLLGVNVSVYRVNDISDPAVKFKLEANCNQLHMTGIVLLYKNLNVVVVEGGPKQQKKFRRLMLNRIKWSEINSKKSVEDREGAQGNEKNQCFLVWEGSVKNRNFGSIIFKMCPTVTFARDFFKKVGCEHYWDIAQTDAIIQQSDA